MVWWCAKHDERSIDDRCSSCERDYYLKDFAGFKAGIHYGVQDEKFDTDRDAYDDWKRKLKFTHKLAGK